MCLLPALPPCRRNITDAINMGKEVTVRRKRPATAAARQHPSAYRLHTSTIAHPFIKPDASPDQTGLQRYSSIGSSRTKRTEPLQGYPSEHEDRHHDPKPYHVVAMKPECHDVPPLPCQARMANSANKHHRYREQLVWFARHTITPLHGWMTHHPTS